MSRDPDPAFLIGSIAPHPPSLLVARKSKDRLSAGPPWAEEWQHKLEIRLSRCVIGRISPKAQLALDRQL